MPHIPDTHHDTHDLELVAAFAAGDATGDYLTNATALVADCTECAALHHDLRAIAAAMPELPEPVRPRDFRLTPEQAASLRPGGLRGFLATLAGPRFAFATPLGSGLAAIGIVGVLVASGGFARGGATSATSATTAPEVVSVPAADGTANQAAGAALASEAPATIAPDGYSSLKSAASPAAIGASPVPDTAGDAAAAGGAGATEGESSPATDSAGDAALPPLLPAAIVLVFVGSALVGARLVGRRVTEAA